jgi:hypothetical protein
MTSSTYRHIHRGRVSTYLWKSLWICRTLTPSAPLSARISDKPHLNVIFSTTPHRVYSLWLEFARPPIREQRIGADPAAIRSGALQKKK